MKYIIYARRSTEDREDRQVLSIDSQIEEVQRKFPGLEIVEIIRESKSAYKPYNRPEFQRMVELFQNGKVQGLLAWHPDRLSREPISGGMAMHLLDQGFIKDLKFASYNFDNSPEGKMMLALVLSQSKYFSEKLSVDVKRGMIKKCKMGCMPTKPPLGYMPDKLAEKGEKRHIKDPERFDLVRKMWDLMLTGQYPILKIVRIANQWGLTTRPSRKVPAQPLSKSTVYKVFSNTYYTGKFEWDGEIHQGQHPPMVTLEEFEKVQQLLGRRYVPRAKKYDSLTAGLIRCSCGAIVVVEKKIKFVKAENLTRLYEYVRCTRQKKGNDCKEPQIKLKDLESQIIVKLGGIKISDAFHKWAIKNIHQQQDKELKDRTSEVSSLRKAHDECQKKLDNLLSLKISPANSDGSLLTDDEFKVRKAEITKERDRLSEVIQQQDFRADKWADALTEAFDTAVNAQRMFEEAKENVQKKKEILAKIGANFLLSNGKLHIEAKRAYIAIENKLPEIRQVEERGRLEIERYGKPKKATLREMISGWSG